MNKILRTLFTLAFGMLLLPSAYAQQDVENPTILYGQQRRLPIGGIKVEGVENYEDYLLIGISGLSIGEQVTLPGDEITAAVKRYWKHGLFSSVRIEAEKIQNDSLYLKIILAARPRVSEININGVRKSEKEDLEEKIGIMKGIQITPNMVDRAKIVIKRYFDDKGFKNAEAEIVQRDDLNKKDQVIVDVNIDKKEKVKVNKIYITGNDHIKTRKFHGNFFSGGLLKKTNEKGFKSLFKTQKFVDEKYAEDKERVIEKYNELGYRDAQIVADSVVPAGENLVDVYIHIDEGQRYYVRNIDWVGNTIYNTEGLSRVLRMEKGDVYNQKHIKKRLEEDDDAVKNYYYNDGYVFIQVNPTEMNVDGDSIDLEVRIVEGIQAAINKIKIYGNTRVYEEVIRRELKLKPGDLFSREALMRSYRELASLGHFDENIDPKVEPDRINGTVDINWGLTSKSNDQIEFSLGYGQTGVIGRIGLKFSNFCMANLFSKKALRRGVMPMGNGESFSISGQTNGRYYQAYSVNYMNPWFGGKRPNTFSLGAFFSKQTDVSDNYYNSAYYNNYFNSYLYGMGNSSYNYYENYYDPSKYVMLFGITVGWGKRLRWPDDWFMLSAELSYTRYMLKNWQYFLMSNGNCNNINLGLTLSRNSTDNPIYPRKGSEFILTGTITPPYSAFIKKDYANLATNPNSATYNKEMQEKYRWIEYHKWKFKSRTYTALSGRDKCFVLSTRVEFGILGHYNKNKRSPFETFYVGGDGTSGYSTTYATETIGMRGYDNGSLTPRGESGYAYDRFTVELRYPIILSNSTNLFALAFAEGGNAWSDIKKFNPLDMKRSVGIGARIFLPMVGLLGIDWAYGFDSVFGSKTYAGSHFHFILGQEF